MASKYIRVESGIYQNPENQVFYVRKTFRKFRIPDLFKSTGETKIGKARTKATVMITDHLNEFLGGVTVGIEGAKRGRTFGEVADEVLRVECPRKRATTQDQYKRFLGELKSEWGTWELSRITLNAFADWLNAFRAKKPNRKTFGDYAKYMNKVMSFAYSRRYVTHALSFKAGDTTTSRWRIYTPEEVKALWAVLGNDSRDQFVLSFECMMRLREVLKLSWDRVDLEAGTITLRAIDVKTGSKTGKGRTFRMSPNALKRMKRRKLLCGKSPWVFPSPTDSAKPMHQNKTAWITAKRKAKITGSARWHDLRHTAISWALLDHKKDPILVSEYAGVSLATIQRVYLHSTADKTADIATAISVTN